MRLIDADELKKIITQDWFLDILLTQTRKYDMAKNLVNMIDSVPLAYDVDAVVKEVEKLDLDGISMVEDGKYKLIRKKEAISLIQTNGICKGRYKTCAECYKKDCPLSTEKTITDKWGDEVRKGGVNE